MLGGGAKVDAVCHACLLEFLLEDLAYECTQAARSLVSLCCAPYI